MRIISHKARGYAKSIEALNRRAEPASHVEKSVAAIIRAVRSRGDSALFSYARKFDKVQLTAETLRVSRAELRAATKSVSKRTQEIVAAAHRNVTQFAVKSMRKDWKMKNAQGAEVGEVFQPFDRVGIYVPGGSAPLVSTSIMTVAIARAAGVPEIAVCTPCGPDGSINQALLYALQIAGATEIYKVGGAHAIAALAWGTASIPPVTKIFGPGNSYVVEAKRQAFGVVAIDLLPGPSEVLILADKTGRADWIAADLLAQAEHGGDSVAGLISDSLPLINDVKAALKAQLKTLSRQKQLQQSLKEGCFAVHVPSMAKGLELVNAFAPEHVTLIARNPEPLISRIRTAGAIFVGNDSPVTGGDFLAGPSHTLPTGGAGKSFAGLTVDQFQRRTSIVRFDQKSIRKSAQIIEDFSALEGLDAHGRSATIRLES
ncbi:MAG: histidinol dehydrogenase [Verrucomicrobiae bacterium]|nr:histidinol dehydrogenase [Verrucomicrobiae bacterium]